MENVINLTEFNVSQRVRIKKKQFEILYRKRGSLNYLQSFSSTYQSPYIGYRPQAI